MDGFLTDKSGNKRITLTWQNETAAAAGDPGETL